MSTNSTSGRDDGRVNSAGQGNSDNTMCDQREQLIGYLYDECDRDERRAVEVHLRDCQACRDEIGALGAVRQDLLAWDVPPYQSVWRPFVAPRTTNPWREMPAWAMAAAATLVFLAGAAGGAVTAAVKPAPVSAGVTAADLAALKTSVIAQVRSEMEQRVVAVAAHDTTPARPAPASGPSKAAYSDVLRRVALLEDFKDQQVHVNVLLNNDNLTNGNRFASLNGQRQSGLVPINFER
jgi:hypothetical protein